jgi:RimJ/RimL family protein N-acetyltransferase
MGIKTVKKSGKKSGKKSVSTKKLSAKLSIKPVSLKLLDLSKLNSSQIEQLANITGDTNIMKHIGTGKPWTIDDIKLFIKDEKIDQKKPHNKRQYYSFVILLYDDRSNDDSKYRVAGYISGRKKRSILTKPFDRNPYNVILRILVGGQYQGKGIAKSAVKLFIEKYKNVIPQPNRTPNRTPNNTHNTVIIADIDKNNIGSIKTMLANDFKYYGVVKYVPKSLELNRYIYSY